MGRLSPTTATGATGPQGPAGVGLNWRGAWSAGATYSPIDAVSYSNASYRAVNAVGPSATTPDIDTTNWAIVAAQAGPTDQAVLARYLADFARDSTLMSGHISQSIPRLLPVGTCALTSGTLEMVGCPVIGGRAYNHITFQFAGAAATVTHLWAGIWDASRALVGVTNDDVAASHGASSMETLDLASTYTPTSGALVYVGVVIVAGTPGSLTGLAQANPVGQTPVLAGSSTAALTNPASAPNPAAALSAKSPFWVSLS